MNCEHAKAGIDQHIMSTTSTMYSSFQLKPSLLSVNVKLQRGNGLRSLPLKKPSSSVLRTPSPGAPNRVKSAQSTGSAAGLNLTNGLEVATARKTKGKVIHQIVDDYGADIGRQSSMHATEKGIPHSGDHTGGTTGLLVWAASVGGVLVVGALIILIAGVCHIPATPDYTLPLL